jgi:hypothetical protein
MRNFIFLIAVYIIATKTNKRHLKIRKVQIFLHVFGLYQLGHF